MVLSLRTAGSASVAAKNFAIAAVLLCADVVTRTSVGVCEQNCADAKPFANGTVFQLRPERESSHSGRDEENRANDADEYRCVPDRSYPGECCDRAQSNGDLEQSNAVGKSVMLMHQMVGFGGFPVALRFLFPGDLRDCNLLAGVALAL